MKKIAKKQVVVFSRADSPHSPVRDTEFKSLEDVEKWAKRSNFRYQRKSDCVVVGESVKFSLKFSLAKFTGRRIKANEEIVVSMSQIKESTDFNSLENVEEWAKFHGLKHRRRSGSVFVTYYDTAAKSDITLKYTICKKRGK